MSPKQCNSSPEVLISGQSNSNPKAAFKQNNNAFVSLKQSNYTLVSLKQSNNALVSLKQSSDPLYEDIAILNKLHIFGTDLNLQNQILPVNMHELIS